MEKTKKSTKYLDYLLSLKYETFSVILISEKLKNNSDPSIIWELIHDWLNFDTKNRLTHFKKIFKEYFQDDCLPKQFVENVIFQSVIFRLLPIDFQTNLKNFVKTNFLLVCINVRTGSVEWQDYQNNIWHSSSLTLQLPNEQHYFQLSLLGNIVYAFGGRDDKYFITNKMWSLDLSKPASFEWAARPAMNQKREWFSSVVFNDIIYAIGGVKKDKNSNSCFLISSERYDSQMKQWSAMANMNIARGWADATVFNSCIYIAGGKSEKGVEQSVEKYDPQFDTWTLVESMTTARFDFALTPFAGRLWAIGGRNSDNYPMCMCESYDPVTDTWREEAPMKEVRSGHATIDYFGELYVVGGEHKKCSVEKFLPGKGWIENGRFNFIYLKPQLIIVPKNCATFFTSFNTLK